MGISIFAQPAHTNTNPSQPHTGGPVRCGHLQRVSSMIRGEQIAERLGAKLNPSDGYWNDVCVYVKPHIKPGSDFYFEGHPYLDIIDAWSLTPHAQARPDVGVIACSNQDGATLRGMLPNPITVIPQHHANFENTPRTRVGVGVVGVIGTNPAFVYLPHGLEQALHERGMQLIKFSRFFSRADIINFYQSIDVQIVWRPYRMRLSNPLKLVNGASFGVPSIVYRESVFTEMDGCYIPVSDLAGFLSVLDRLRASPAMQADYSGRCLERAEAYHIDRVCQMYRRLN